MRRTTKVGYEDNPVQDTFKDYFRLQGLRDLAHAPMEQEPELDVISDPVIRKINPVGIQPENPGQINMDVRANQELPDDNPFVTGIAPAGASFVGGQQPEPNIFQRFVDYVHNVPPEAPEQMSQQATQQAQPNIDSLIRDQIPESPVPIDPKIMDVGKPFNLSDGGQANSFGGNPSIAPTAPQEEREPFTFTQPGTAQQVLAQPDLRSAIEERFGLQVTPQMQTLINDYEVAAQSYKQRLNEFDETLSAQQQQIKQRLANRDLTTQDKILLGIALIAPSLGLALSGNNQAALGALGGGLGGIGKALSNRDQQFREDEALLGDLGLARVKAAKEGLGVDRDNQEFIQKIKESHPNAEVRKLFEQNGSLLNGQLVLETGNELLPLKANRIQNEADVKRFKDKIMPDLNNEISVVRQTDQNLDNMAKLVELGKQKDSQRGLGGTIGHTLGSVTPFINIFDEASQTYKAFVPSARSTFEDEDGVEHNISSLYNTLRTQSSDLYRKANVKGANFKASEIHFLNQIRDPFSESSFTGGASRWDDTLASIEAARHKSKTGLIENAEAAGVDTSRLKQQFQNTPSTQKKNDTKKDTDRANRAADQVLKGNQ